MVICLLKLSQSFAETFEGRSSSEIDELKRRKKQKHRQKQQKKSKYSFAIIHVLIAHRKCASSALSKIWHLIIHDIDIDIDIYSWPCYRCFLRFCLHVGRAHSFIFHVAVSARAFRFRNRLFGKTNSDRRRYLHEKWIVIEAAIWVKCSRKQRQQRKKKKNNRENSGIQWRTGTEMWLHIFVKFRYVVSFSICRMRQFSN